MALFSNIAFSFFIACAFRGIDVRCNDSGMQPSESEEDDWLSLPRAIAVDDTPEEDLLCGPGAQNASVPDDDWL